MAVGHCHDLRYTLFCKNEVYKNIEAQNLWNLGVIQGLRTFHNHTFLNVVSCGPNCKKTFTGLLTNFFSFTSFSSNLGLSER